jgi:hypothetical protein
MPDFEASGSPPKPFADAAKSDADAWARKLAAAQTKQKLTVSWWPRVSLSGVPTAAF